MKTDLIDFHAHLMSAAGLEKICPETQKSDFFRYVVPVLEPIAHLTEPVHDRFLRYMAMHHNNFAWRFLYSQCGQLFLMEALRLFRRHGLERLIKSMESQGIGRTVVCSLEPLTQTQEILDAVARYSDRFSVFASVARQEKDPVGYLAPFIESGKISGIKIHSMVGGFDERDFYESTREFVALADENELPVSIHTGHIPVEALVGFPVCNEVAAVEPLVRAFPRCQFVLNHVGWESWRRVLDMAQRYSNIMVETSWQSSKVIRRAVDSLGAHRVLFGSDYPMFQQGQALAEVKEALTQKEIALVASENAHRVLKLEATDLRRQYMKESEFNKKAATRSSEPEKC